MSVVDHRTKCVELRTEEEGADDRGHDLSSLIVNDELAILHRFEAVVAASSAPPFILKHDSVMPHP